MRKSRSKSALVVKKGERKRHWANATRKKKSKPRSKFRASWKGSIRFDLVSFEVQAINAEVKEKAEIHFHLLHEPDHQRIHYAKMCPKYGEVPNDEIVEGFEYGKGRYIEVEKEVRDALRTDKERALTIDAFVPPDRIWDFPSSSISPKCTAGPSRRRAPAKDTGRLSMSACLSEPCGSMTQAAPFVPICHRSV
jgi:hypothetical protein